MTKPDPEPWPVQRSQCPHCRTSMIVTNISQGPEGFERLAFVCPHCGAQDVKMIALDPLKSGAR
jgi:Zn finger protein HypA/HybF involved in hydrogenase expression